ncbi:MAG: hypothetical protein NTZ84_01275 [Candidatus Nealsonbacteria bacterium]|nr:hypothetical protein [Candidatus Nealsonbacteria bacterium]
MTKKSRTILFLICVFLFLLICPLTVLYSQGYRISFDYQQGGIKISKTGGFFVKAYPKQVDVLIEEVGSSKKTIKEKTDFFFGSLLVENLFPKKYKVEIKKEGYLPWQKVLEVKEKEVTGIKNIILFPENKEFTVFAQDLKNFWFFPDHKKIIFQEEGENSWSLKSYDLNNNVKSHLIDNVDISTKKSELIGLEISPDSREINLEVAVSKNITYFKIDLEKNPPALIKIKSPIAATGTDLVSEKFNNDTYSLDNLGNLFKNKEKLNDNPFTVKQEAKYVLKVSPDFIFLLEDKTLYKFNHDLKLFEKLSDDINDLKISPGSKTLAYLTDYEVWLFFLKDKESEPTKKAGEKIILLRLSEKIKDFYWLNEDYLILNIGNAIRIIEIDNRNNVQSWGLADLSDPKMFFNDFDKKLYVLSENKLYCSNVLLP